MGVMAELCLLKIHILKSKPLVPHHVIVFGEGL